MILFYAHILGCLWHYVGSHSGKQNWISKANIEDETWSEKYNSKINVISRYIYSVYWAVTTMSTVGYGDLTPLNSKERVFCIFTMLFSSIIFAYSLNTIGTIVTSITETKRTISTNMTIINRLFLKLLISL
jgi:hypothetical protein